MAENPKPLTIRTPSLIGEWLRRNPVTVKELRGRMRGARAMIVLTAYVLVMSLFTTLLYWLNTGFSTVTLSTTGSWLGIMIFGGVLTIELFMVCFIAPAFTAGAISGERERQTYHLLRTTLLSAWRLVIGKLSSALAYTLLLLLAAIPLQSLAFLMGGITMTEVAMSIWLLVVTAIAYSAMGIYFSALSKKTLNASVLTYVVSLFITVAVPMILIVGLTLFSVASLSMNSAFQPMIEMVLLYVMGLLACTNPITTAILTWVTYQQYNTLFYFTVPTSNGISVPMLSPWIIFTLLYALITFLAINGSVRQVRKVDV
jgi:hypothetical protein